MDENKKDTGNHSKSPDNKRPKGNIWIALIITVVIVLMIGSIYNYAVKSQYTETDYNHFLSAMEKGELTEVQLQYDRIVYMT